MGHSSRAIEISKSGLPTVDGGNFSHTKVNISLMLEIMVKLVKSWMLKVARIAKVKMYICGRVILSC